MRIRPSTRSGGTNEKLFSRGVRAHSPTGKTAMERKLRNEKRQKYLPAFLCFEKLKAIPAPRTSRRRLEGEEKSHKTFERTKDMGTV
jgi:hypothetical protein